jgi:hypothetical protein
MHHVARCLFNCRGKHSGGVQLGLRRSLEMAENSVV